MNIQEIEAKRHRHVGPNLSVSYRKPLHIVRGEGQFLYDPEGNAYLDMVNNVCHVGHCHPRVVQAGQEQMAVLNTNTRYLHEHLVNFAERLAGTLPDPLEVCYFVSSGSEATELALRLSRTHTKRTDMIVSDHAYHGSTGNCVDMSPYKFDGKGGQGAPPWVHKAMAPDVYRGPYKADDPEAGKKYAAHVGELIADARANGREIAGFIIESMISCGGQLIPPDGYLEEVYRIVREDGGVVIADEVQVGFGRAGTHFWAFETQGVVPDIVTLGKPIGNGHPLAAVITTPEIAASFDNGMEYFATFGGNPVSCAIGLAVLDVIEDEGLQENARVVGEKLLKDTAALMEKHALIGDVRGWGLFVGIELVRDRATLEPASEEAYTVIEKMRDRQILLSTEGPHYNIIKIKPPIVFSEKDADHFVTHLDEVLTEMADSSHGRR